MFSSDAAFAPREDLSLVLMEAVEVEKHFVGQLILPVHTSKTMTGRYPKFKTAKGGLLNRESTKRNRTGSYNEVEREFEWDPYLCQEFGLKERVDDVVREQMVNQFDAEALTAKLLMRSIMLDFEVEVAGKVQDPTTFTTEEASLDYTEANIDTFDFPADVNARIEALTLAGENANVMVIPLQVFNRVRRSKKLQTYMFGHLNSTQGSANITAEMMAAAFMLESVIVTKQSYNLAAKNKPAQLGSIWKNDFVFLGNIQGGEAEGDFAAGGVGRTIIFDADSPGGLFTTETYRDEDRRSDMVRVRSNRDTRIMNPNAGALIQTNWA